MPWDAGAAQSGLHHRRALAAAGPDACARWRCRSRKRSRLGAGLCPRACWRRASAIRALRDGSLTLLPGDAAGLCPRKAAARRSSASSIWPAASMALDLPGPAQPLDLGTGRGALVRRRPAEPWARHQRLVRRRSSAFSAASSGSSTQTCRPAWPVTPVEHAIAVRGAGRPARKARTLSASACQLGSVLPGRLRRQQGRRGLGQDTGLGGVGQGGDPAILPAPARPSPGRRRRGCGRWPLASGAGRCPAPVASAASRRISRR